MKRIYLPTDLNEGGTTILPDNTFHHLFRVMRCRSNESLVAFNGDGVDYQGTVEQTSKKTAQFCVTSAKRNTKESSLYTILLQGLSKNDHMDTAIQKAVELGVNEIHPVRCEFSNTKLDKQRLAKKQNHWQSIIIAACEQSERAVIPKLHPLLNVNEALEKLDSPCKVILHPYDNEKSRKPLPNETDKVAIFVGPEGGFSEQEVQETEREGFQRLTLGSRILRTETATVSALSVAQYQWGDFRGI